MRPTPERTQLQSGKGAVRPVAAAGAAPAAEAKK
jgi:hypothetical protein